MPISEKELNEIGGESPKYSEKFGRKAFKSKYQSDLIKGIVEIIKNGVDAYLDNYNFKDGPGKIKVILDTTNKRYPIIKVINFAKGMNIKEFSSALKIGEATRSTKDTITGAHGYGMKEAAWAFSQTKIISVVGGKYSYRIFYWDKNDLPKYAWKKDKKGRDILGVDLTQEIIKETDIKDEGTYFEGIIPDNINCPTFDTLRYQLSNHILLRTINQSENFEITLELNDSKLSKFHIHNLKYIPPQAFRLREDREELEKDSFSFKYPKYGVIDCEYGISLAPHELERTGDCREAGILLCAGPYSVLDCTLFDHGDKVSSRFFGKAILTGKRLREILKEEKVIDDKREAGILKKTPLWEGLYNYFHPLLEKLIDEERRRLNKKTSAVEKGILDDQDYLIKEFNKIARDEAEDLTDIRGDIKFDPGIAGIRFCIPGEYLSLIENDEKNVYLVADPAIIPEGSKIEIKIKDNKDGLSISPQIFKIDKKDIDEDERFKKKISFKSSIIDTFLVTAYVQGMLNKAEMNVESLRDPRLHIKNPLEFISTPSEIVSGKSKKFPLIIDFSKIDKDKKITFESDKIFSLNEIPGFKEAEKINKDIYELLIDIHCSGKPRQKGQIKAAVDNNEAILNLEVIDSRERNLKGNFEGIDNDTSDDPFETGYFNKKIIYICINHPLFKHYRIGNELEMDIAYRVLYADIIIREFCKELARNKLKIFENTTAEDYRVKFNRNYENLYKKHVVRLHKICINPKLLEKLKIKAD